MSMSMSLSEPLSSRVVLITGASRGIGASLAEHLASIGYKRLCLVARNGQMLRAVGDMCRKLGANNILTLSLDLASESGCHQAVEQTIEHFGQLDVLIANAGVMEVVHPRDVNWNNLNRVFNVNLKGPMVLTAKALPHIAKAAGAIVYLSSVDAHTTLPGLSVYGASKAALNAYASTIASSEAANSVRVNVVEAGPILTDMLIQTAHGLGLTTRRCEVANAFARRLPLGFVGLPDDMAKLIAFLISDDNRYMTGAIIPCDGGARIASSTVQHHF